MPRGSTAPLVLAAVAVGGAVGAAARFGIAAGWPGPVEAGPPWPTLVTNLVGCALIGVLMRVVTAVPRPHRLLRPFLGAGVLGGFTTFSVQTLEVADLLAAGRPWLAGGYTLGTLVGALGAVWLGGAAARPLADRLARRVR
ncbi:MULTISPECIES: CrcB family protein [unclassified Solwaraspora]|uniref:fluoride efflux transporter FluC n=1 Tax=unclassified Solwaraspora TaxID=2627926 RepID=UPI00248D18A6|nr:MULTISPECIES: CrcB family protein [unclassified Solwaraspora]WBC00482.1 CrcB family protein [Solwaraspora sp. WMMA2059]WBC23909.1 CrcB family protein [Solwaraspora sp. WMMA2080]WJK37874.1 CrcB family protein [Solwaraspora sp. WMMA2065]